MRTAIVCGGPHMGGKEIMAIELGEGLRSKGCQVEYVTSHWTDGVFYNRVQTLGFPTHRFWFGFISLTFRFDALRMTAHQLLRWPQLLAGYRRFLRRANPDKVIHTTWHSLLMILPFLKPERDLFWLHEVIPDKPQYRRVFGWLSRRLGCFVPVSQAVAESLRNIGIPDHKINVIHNGITDPAPVQKHEQNHDGKMRIGMVGRVCEWKGHEDILEAFAQIAAKHPATELHVLGTGDAEFENMLRQRAEMLGVASRVVWHGFVANRTEIYSQLDICAVPSRSADPLPTVAIEAAFFRIPVVATRRGGLPEIIKDTVTGFLVEPRNPAELSARLDDLLTNHDLRQRMGAAAQRRATEHFSRERFVADFIRLMNKNANDEFRMTESMNIARVK